MAVRSPQDIYARHVSSSRGYPLWTPESSSQRPEGLRIGDVGVVVPENGSFDVLFNVCIPKDHHFHQVTGVPDGFSPIELSDADIKTVPNVEGAGRILKATSVTRVDSDGASVGGEVLPRIGVTGYTFKLSSAEGALLVLPEGAESHDVRDTRPFLEQAARHAVTWYRFAEEDLGRIISHDAIYVITGFHKARSWALAGYQNEQGNGDFSAQLTVGPHEDGSPATSYSWETTRSMDWRVGPIDGLGIPNQSVFIRGFKIALRSSVQGVPQRWVSFQPNRLDVQSNLEAPSSESWLANAWRGISRSIGMSSGGAEREQGRENVGVHVEIQRIPEILPVFHPSDVINQYILQKEPSAKVAITHDSDWGSILDKGVLKPEELVRDELLTKAISEKYSVALQEGVAYLQSKSDETMGDSPETQATKQALRNGVGDPVRMNGENKAVRPTHCEPLSVVSESNYRCVDESASGPVTSESRSADLQSIPSKFGTASGVSPPTLPESLRPIKIIIISDFLCAFCYICGKVIQDAVEACRDLPIRFDMEFRPFALVNLPPTPVPSQVMYRNAYLVKKFGREQAEIKMKAVGELSQKARLNLSEDSIICNTTQAHRLCVKAYHDGGQELQNKLVTLIFDASLSKEADISEQNVLADAAANAGLMSKDSATEFLQSTEYSDCVEQMIEAARAHGINGVPFVIIDGKWAVNGLQPVECFIQIFRKLAHLPACR